ncbi:MAG: ArsR/SmtB family transcription factor [Bulleidia sp.]
MSQRLDADTLEACRKAMLDESTYDEMSMLFMMFADSTRLKIMNALFIHSLCVSDLCILLQMSPSAISHQLASLKKIKLVRSRKEGKMVYYAMADEHVKNIWKMAYDHTQE